MASKRKQIAGLSETEAQKYVETVQGAVTAIDTQEHVVRGCAAKLREERATLSKLKANLIEVAKPLPLLDHAQVASQ